MLSYNNDTKLKKLFVAEVENHRKLDMIVQGTYGEGQGDNWKGCAVGCAVHSLNKINGTRHQTYNHKVYEEELGMPEWLARLEDTIFEGLPKKEAMLWPVRFAKAVPVGVDLEPVKWKFAAYLMRENIARVKKLEISDELKEQVLAAIEGVQKINEDAIKTGKWDVSAAESAESAAWSAEPPAVSAAWSARSAARSAGSAAVSAAVSAAESAARSAESAWSAAFIKHSRKLLSLLKEAK